MGLDTSAWNMLKVFIGCRAINISVVGLDRIEITLSVRHGVNDGQGGSDGGMGIMLSSIYTRRAGSM